MTNNTADAIRAAHASDMDLLNMMNAIDWSRPIVTNAGKPTRTTECGVRNIVEAEWRPDTRPGDVYTLFVWPDGNVCDIEDLHVRNATPAEILAHPDVWPEWQDWAQKNYPAIRIDTKSQEPMPDEHDRKRGWPPLTAAELTRQPTHNWLTPETAIGCTLPCGAKVVEAEWKDRGVIEVDFDRVPANRDAKHGHLYNRDGSHNYKPELPDLIPAAPTPQPITHATILAAVERLPEHLDGPAAIADALCNALGVEVPVKRASWQIAYDAWPHDNPTPYDAWRAAVEWCVEQVGGFDVVRRRIMGEQP